MPTAWKNLGYSYPGIILITNKSTISMLHVYQKPYLQYIGLQRVGHELAPKQQQQAQRVWNWGKMQIYYFELIVVCYYFPLNYVNIIWWELCHACVSATQPVFHSGNIKERSNWLQKMDRSRPTTQKTSLFQASFKWEVEVAWFIGLGSVLSEKLPTSFHW